MAAWLIALLAAYCSCPSVVLAQRPICNENKDVHMVEYNIGADHCLYVDPLGGGHLDTSMETANGHCTALNDKYHAWSLGKMETYEKWQAIINEAKFDTNQLFGDADNEKHLVFWLGLTRKMGSNTWEWTLDNGKLDSSTSRWKHGQPDGDPNKHRCAIGEWIGHAENYSIAWTAVPCQLSLDDSFKNMTGILVCESKWKPDPPAGVLQETTTEETNDINWRWAFIGSCCVIGMLLVAIIAAACVIRHRRRKREKSSALEAKKSSIGSESGIKKSNRTEKKSNISAAKSTSKTHPSKQAKKKSLKSAIKEETVDENAQVEQPEIKNAKGEAEAVEDEVTRKRPLYKNPLIKKKLDPALFKSIGTVALVKDRAGYVMMDRASQVKNDDGPIEASDKSDSVGLKLDPTMAKAKPRKTNKKKM